jgi:hypothetical protein
MDRLAFNGVNGSTGSYLLDPMTVEELADLALGTPMEEERLAELRWRRRDDRTLRLMPGIEPRDLSQTGWAVVFAHDADPAVREALGELLDHRREQASAGHAGYYRELSGPDGHRPGESKDHFLARHGTGPGPVTPENFPYYVLLVGDPERIPYGFQSDLDVAYAVGRLHFQTLEEYERYARTVVEAEAAPPTLPSTATFFGVAHRDDPSTQQSAALLVDPLAERLAGTRPTWQVQKVPRDQATRARLAGLLGEEAPSLLFTASHGVGFDLGDPRQLPHQGALVCNEWPGPVLWGERPITEDCYVAGEHLGDCAGPPGRVALHFACYGAGTPRRDSFAHRRLGGFDRPEIAPHAFVAALPRRLLGRPHGAAVAVIGHVDRAWGSSFQWPAAGPQLAVFQATVQEVMDGVPVGAAVEYFNERYAELSVTVSQLLYDAKYGKPPDPVRLAALWTANNDARGWSVLGDPAARLTVNYPVDEVRLGGGVSGIGQP